MTGAAASADRDRTLAETGERALIARLCKRLAGAATVIVPPGDDAAVVRPPSDATHDWVLTSDPVLEGIHFAAGAEPAAVGHKAVGRALSDLAAMGAEPAWALIDLTAAPEASVAYLERVYDGAAALAARHGLAIVGGDTGRGPHLALHVFAVGRVPRGEAVRRAGARADDALYVTGALGGSGAGRHLAFEPRVAEGIWLRTGGWATAMIDVSDGVATDAGHLAAAGGVALRLDAAAIPVSAAAAAAAAVDGRAPLEHALCDGEDFELLFSVPAARAAAFETAWRARFALPCTRIGAVTAGAGVTLYGPDGARALPGKGGYEHFR